MATIFGATPTNPMEQASQAQRGALAGTVASGMTPIGTLAGTSLTPYMNPYTTSVIGDLRTEAARNIAMGANQLGAEATRAGAFGGSRHGVAQGQMMGDVLRGLGQQTGQLLQSGYTTAQQQAQQDIQNRLAQAQLGMQGAAQLGALGGQSFGYGQQIQSGLAQQGQMQQALQQALIDAAKGQYAGYTGAPATSLGYVASTLGAAPTPTSSTSSGQQQQSTGIFDMLTSGALLGKAFGFFQDLLWTTNNQHFLT